MRKHDLVRFRTYSPYAEWGFFRCKKGPNVYCYFLENASSDLYNLSKGNTRMGVDNVREVIPKEFFYA